MSQEFDVESYKQERRNFFAQINNFSENLGGREYALYLVKGNTREEISNLRYASGKIWEIYMKTYQALANELSDEELMKLGIYPEILKYMRMGCGTDSFLARLDLIMNNNGEIKLLENNSDTPFLEVEAFEMNGKVCDNFGVEDVNKDYLKDIADYYLSEIKYMADVENRNVGDIKVVLTGKMSYEEETQQLLFLQRALGKYVKIEFVPIGDILLCEEDTVMDGEEYARGVYTPEYEYIDVLIRMGHPIDYLVKDRVTMNPNWTAEEKEQYKDYKPGMDLLEMYYEERITLLNPPESYLMQPKSIMALIWEWKDRNDIFTVEERETIEKYFLPTYLEPTYFIENNIPYVQKANIGREGDTVKIFDKDNNLVKSSYGNSYNRDGYVYQQYFEMPKADIVTEAGQQKGSYMYGVFIVHDEPSALAVRIGSEITEHDSYWLACGYRD